MKYNLKVAENEYLPLRDVVFNTLRQAILKGELEPEERLMEIQLAERLGVSRTPVREAIRKLELEGLVIMIPRKGAQVAGITEKGMKDVLEVRKALEELAVELACQKITEEKIGYLEEHLVNFEKAINNGDLTSIAEMDVDFHDTIYSATDNEKLVQMLYNLREQMYRYRVEYIKDQGTRVVLLEEHKEIINTLKNRNIKAAKEAIRRHIDNQKTTVSKRIKK
ncbi:MAG: GntR family transcriptional regulator [Clostridiales bacterium]|nr:GntR family transcriptional regulator [Clostridiales bacterium]